MKKYLRRLRRSQRYLQKCSGVGDGFWSGSAVAKVDVNALMTAAASSDDHRKSGRGDGCSDSETRRETQDIHQYQLPCRCHTAG